MNTSRAFKKTLRAPKWPNLPAGDVTATGPIATKPDVPGAAAVATGMALLP
jgi:hypothetical protein